MINSKIIESQIKKVKCFNCNSSLKEFLQHLNAKEKTFQCSCKLFDFVFYIYPKSDWADSYDFYIKKSNSYCCIISISTNNEICIFEDRENCFTLENVGINFNRTPVVFTNADNLFEIINSNMQMYCKIQNNLIFK